MALPSRNLRQGIYIGAIVVLVAGIDEVIRPVGLVGVIMIAALALASMLDRNWERPWVALFWPFDPPGDSSAEVGR